ncbi:hypothetical protein M8C21_026502, partial [Ambrosia artemisiifolia]
MLRSLFPNLYRLAKDKHVSVAEKIRCTEGVRDCPWAWVKNPNLVGERDNLDSLLNLLQGISVGEGNDRWLWMNADGWTFRSYTNLNRRPDRFDDLGAGFTTKISPQLTNSFT